jgi:hypothetical protein
MFQMEVMYVDSIYLSLYGTISIQFRENRRIMVWALRKLTNKNQN